MQAEKDVSLNLPPEIRGDQARITSRALGSAAFQIGALPTQKVAGTDFTGFQLGQQKLQAQLSELEGAGLAVNVPTLQGLFGETAAAPSPVQPKTSVSGLAAPAQAGPVPVSGPVGGPTAPAQPAPAPAGVTAPLGSTERTQQLIQQGNIAGQRAAQTTGIPFTPAQQVTARAGAGAAVAPGAEVAPTPSPFEDIRDSTGLDIDAEKAKSRPIEALTDFMRDLLELTGAAGGEDAISNLNEEFERQNQELEDILNERDEAVADINENPWLSEGLRLKQEARARDKFASQIKNAEVTQANTLDRLKLSQDQQQARIKQVEFAAKTGIDFLQKQEAFEQGQVEFQAQQALKELVEERKATEPNITTQTSTDASGNVTVTRIDKKTGEIVGQTSLGKVGKPLASALDSQKGPFLTTNFFRTVFSRDQLIKKVKEGGFNKISKNRDEEIDEYLTNLLKIVESYRKAGFTDSEILDLMQG